MIVQQVVYPPEQQLTKRWIIQMRVDIEDFGLRDNLFDARPKYRIFLLLQS